MISKDTLTATVHKLDCCGRTIWRLMALRGGRPCGLGHMIDFDDQHAAEDCAIAHARRNHWPVTVSTYYGPGRPPGSTRSILGPLS